MNKKTLNSTTIISFILLSFFLLPLSSCDKEFLDESEVTEEIISPEELQSEVIDVLDKLLEQNPNPTLEEVNAYLESVATTRRSCGSWRAYKQTKCGCKKTSSNGWRIDFHATYYRRVCRFPSGDFYQYSGKTCNIPCL